MILHSELRLVNSRDTPVTMWEFLPRARMHTGPGWFLHLNGCICSLYIFVLPQHQKKRKILTLGFLKFLFPQTVGLGLFGMNVRLSYDRQWLQVCYLQLIITQIHLIRSQLPPLLCMFYNLSQTPNKQAQYPRGTVVWFLSKTGPTRWCVLLDWSIVTFHSLWDTFCF